MKKIKMGTKATCRMCGKEIEYIGPYWRHTTTSPRHPGTPAPTPPAPPALPALVATTQGNKSAAQMSALREALKRGCSFLISIDNEKPIIAVFTNGKIEDGQLFKQYGFEELDEFELIESAAQAALRILREKTI